MNVIWTTQFGNWTNQVVTLAATVSINIIMYLYQYKNRSMWFNPFKKFHTEVFHIEAVTLTSVHISQMLNLKTSGLSNFHFTKKLPLLTFNRSTVYMLNCEFIYQMQ